MKKDLIEIVTEDGNYYVKGSYEGLKNELKYAGDNTWVSFDEVYRLQEASYGGFREMYTYAKSNREDLLLKATRIISVSKLREGGEES